MCQIQELAGDIPPQSLLERIQQTLIFPHRHRRVIYQPDSQTGCGYDDCCTPHYFIQKEKETAGGTG